MLLLVGTLHFRRRSNVVFTSNVQDIHELKRKFTLILD